MGKKLYVGNLPFSVDQKQLQELFSEFGEIEEAVVISNKFSGRSKGFGFVTFKEDADADKAVSEMNEKEVEGRPLKVNEAQPFDPDKPRRNNFGGGNRRGGGRGGFNRGPRRDNRDSDEGGSITAEAGEANQAPEESNEEPKEE